MQCRWRIKPRLLALLLALSLCLSGCVGLFLPPPVSPDSQQTTAAPDPTSSASLPTGTSALPTVPSAETTEPITEPVTEPVTETLPPIDPDDEALIRWQNAGQKDYLPEEKLEMVPFSEMEYRRPDVEALYADFDGLIEAAKESGDAEALLEAYYGLYTRYMSFDSMDTLANVRTRPSPPRPPESSWRKNTSARAILSSTTTTRSTRTPTISAFPRRRRPC